MAAYRVVAPYVTLKVRDQAGAQVLTGFYEGAVVSDVDANSLRHHLDNGLVEMVEEAAPVPAAVESTEPVEPAGETQTNGRPSVRASKDDWITYAVSQRADGVAEDDAKAAAEAKSKADLIAQFGG